MNNIISSHDLLIGHGLDNDFECLKIIHTNIIDTSILFKNRTGAHKPKLKILVKQILFKNIQNDGDSLGHDSIEDSQSALDLVYV